LHALQRHPVGRRESGAHQARSSTAHTRADGLKISPQPIEEPHRHHSGVHVDGPNDSMDRWNQHLPIGGANHVDVVAAGLEDVHNLAEGLTVDRADVEADDLIPEVGVGVEPNGVVERYEQVRPLKTFRVRTRLDIRELQDYRPPYESPALDRS